MSSSIVYSRALLGMSAPEVTIEVHLSRGLPAFNIVGLPEKAVKESRDRVRSALMNNGFEMPAKRITVNLAPADLPKQSGRYDLPIAVGLLASLGVIQQSVLSKVEMIGELGLLGDVRGCSGVLPMVLACRSQQRELFLPLANAEEAALVESITLFAVSHLLPVVSHLQKIELIVPYQARPRLKPPLSVLDMQDVSGQENAKRALLVAAAGGHSVLMSGPPGSGKSMLAARLPSLLPPLSSHQAIETAACYALSQHSMPKSILQPPFRAPHHTASAVALVGGGSPPQPGEVSLAHHGVLFLDELLEFSRSVLEALREPMENGNIAISRAAFQARFPASFQLIAAMNPCPCGFLSDKEIDCPCSAEQISRYRAKLSGPILDRIDLHIEVARQSASQLMLRKLSSLSSVEIRKRVIVARQRQELRQGKLNARLTAQELRSVDWLAENEKEFLIEAIDHLKLSARSFFRSLKVARSIADIEEEDDVLMSHLSEALSWRQV